MNRNIKAQSYQDMLDSLKEGLLEVLIKKESNDKDVIARKKLNEIYEFEKKVFKQEAA